MVDVEAVRVVVLEDDERLRREIERSLGAASPPIIVERTFASVGEALAGLADPRLAFDVALVDLKLPDGSGLSVIEKIRQLRPNASPVAITIFDDPPTVLAAIRAGARGYLLKGWTPDQLAACVRDAAAGGAPLSPRVARYVLDMVRAPSTSPEPMLTGREQDVLDLLCQGRTYREVGIALSIALGTVQTHVKSIYGKLEVESKTELAAAAFRRGLVR